MNRSSVLSDSCAHAIVAMSKIFWYYLFHIKVLFGVLFVIHCCVLVFSCRCFDVLLFKNHQGYKEEDLEQQKVGSKARVP
jgi:hypothetical protein